MSNKKFRKGKKNEVSRVKELEIEDLAHTLKTQKWEYDFDVTNKYTFNDIQNQFLDSIQKENSNAAIVDGPAGTAKTYLAVLAALKLVAKRKLENIVYVRSVVESANKSIGSLPGEIDEKFAPWAMPLNDKLEELVSPSVIKNLISTNVIKCIPVNFLRGLTFRNSFVIVDEAQNLTLGELTTILTRFGHNSKYVIAGDSLQADIGKISGFNKILTAFTSPECVDKGIYTFKFTENEIVRSEILRFIVNRLKTIG
jgi:phosphate starvation-inducible PhoH-like protein